MSIERRAVYRNVICWGWWITCLFLVAPAVMAEEVIEDATGTMREVGTFGFGIVPDDDPGTRYAPTEAVPGDFRVDGMRVVFGGIVGDPAEGRGGRRWGTPITLTSLKRLAPEDDPDVSEQEDDPESDSDP